MQGKAGCHKLRLPEAALRDEEGQGGARISNENGKVGLLRDEEGQGGDRISNENGKVGLLRDEECQGGTRIPNENGKVGLLRDEECQGGTRISNENGKVGLLRECIVDYVTISRNMTICRNTFFSFSILPTKPLQEFFSVAAKASFY